MEMWDEAGEPIGESKKETIASLLINGGQCPSNVLGDAGVVPITFVLLEV